MTVYIVDEHDKVIELRDLPQSSVGAPCPIVLAGEHSLAVAYFVQDTPADWDGTTVRVVGPGNSGEPAAIVRFARPYASMFGPPNDEAFAGHPLAARGLRPYGAFEVQDSSWIRRLEKTNESTRAIVPSTSASTGTSSLPSTIRRSSAWPPATRMSSRLVPSTSWPHVRPHAFRIEIERR